MGRACDRLRLRPTIVLGAMHLASLACGATPQDEPTPASTGTGAITTADGGAATADPDSAGDAMTTVDPDGTSAGGDSNDTQGDDTQGDDGDGLGPAEFDDGELDAVSNGGTITFREIGATGWYPSRRDPAIGPCDAYEANGCCMAQHEVTDDALTPWVEDLVLTLRGPMQIKQLAVYRSADADAWSLVSGWTDDDPQLTRGLAFDGEFTGEIGTECLVDVSTDLEFPCGDGSEPYCPPSDEPQYSGWDGSKLFVVLARMPHVDMADVGEPCSEDTGGNWWDAPWIGLSLGELARAGAFSSCQCYAKNPDEWWLGDGCGQFNVFEVVNDNNEFRNLDVFSTNFFGYAGYVGEGPCGDQCDVSGLDPAVDLIDKSANAEASGGAEASPTQGPGAAFRRPAAGYRYFVVALDAASRTVQLAVVHPLDIPAQVSTLLPDLPATLSRADVDAVLGLRLPQ